MSLDFAHVLNNPDFGNTGGEYDKFVQLAARLIKKKGRNVEFIRDTSSGLIDITKPHLGRRTRTNTAVIKALFDQPSVFQDFQQTTDDDLIKQAKWTAWIAAQGLPAAPGIKDKIRTLGTIYQITDQVSLAPGNEPIIFLVLLGLV